MADDQKTIPLSHADKIEISLTLDAALKAYRDAYGADRYLARVDHARDLAVLACAAEEHGRLNAK